METEETNLKEKETQEESNKEPEQTEKPEQSEKPKNKKKNSKLKSTFRKESIKLTLNALVSLAIIIALIVYRPEWRWVAMGGGLVFMLFDIKKLFTLRTQYSRKALIPVKEFYIFVGLVAAAYIAAVPCAFLL